MERYQDKKVVIIGGTSGMGLATAKMLLDGGARVLVTGRSKAGAWSESVWLPIRWRCAAPAASPRCG